MATNPSLDPQAILNDFRVNPNRLFKIPVQLHDEDFKEHVLPYLSMPRRGPKSKIPYSALFNYILKVLYTGMQWRMIPIRRSSNGNPEIHYTGIYKLFARWCDDGSLAKVFKNSVKTLHDLRLLDTSVLHGDGTNTVAKKGATKLITRGTNTKRVKRR
jgi:transposase